MRAIAQVLSFDLIAKLLLGISGIILIRIMSEVEYSLYTLLMSLSAMASQVLATSFNRIFIVGYERLGLSSASSHFLGVQVWLMGIMLLATLPLAATHPMLYGCAAVISVTTCLSEFARSFYRQEMRFIRFSLLDVGRAFVVIVGILALAVVTEQQVAAWQIAALQSAALFGVFVVGAANRIKFKDLLAIKPILSLFSTVVAGPYRYLFGYAVLLAILTQVDVLTLKVLAGDASLAAYGSARRYYALMLMGLSAVHVVLLPSVQRASQFDELDRIFRQFGRVLWLLVPGVLAAISLAPWLIPWIDGGRYPEAVPVFQVLTLSAGISLAFSPYVNILMKAELFRYLLVLVGSALIISVSLNMLLVPWIGALGSAISTLIGNAVVNGMTFWRARTYVQGMRTTATL
jgi:Membrane protein involved in the export of O-antigen and teichoic acid